MNPVDLLLLALMVLAAITGARAGFVTTTYGLITWVVALLVALALQGPIAALLGQAGLGSAVGRPAGFIVALLVLETAFTLLGRVLVGPVVRSLHRSRSATAADRILGVIPGILRVLVIAAIALAAALVLPVGNDVRATIDGSRIAQVLVAQVSRIQPTLGSFAGEPDGASLVVTKLGADDTQKLDLPDALTLVPDPEAEQQLFALVNGERTARGLNALEWDPRLVPVARSHSEEMFRSKYFGHRSPVAGSPFDRLAAAKIAYRRAGENLAYAHSVAAAHRGLMESPGHRENILHPEYTRIGIGVISAGAYGRMFTQLFLTP
ncbi:MAG TPA: CvpA family protein [Candidatus Limnocylindria bacterium]|jgi:uncharacterized protein YkwD/uncharacterized membrane protein required for colicin V production